jgi:cytochrome c5
VQHALDGHGAMPPRGGNAMLSDAQVRAAVRYMISRAMAAQRGTP